MVTGKLLSNVWFPRFRPNFPHCGNLRAQLTILLKQFAGVVTIYHSFTITFNFQNFTPSSFLVSDWLCNSGEGVVTVPFTSPRPVYQQNEN